MTKQWQPLPDGMKYYEARGLAYSILDNGEAFVAGVEQGRTYFRFPPNVKVCELVEVEPWQPAIPWELVPDEAEWIVPDHEGDLLWHVGEPFFNLGARDWKSERDWDYLEGEYERFIHIDIPLGRDWRQCKWRRPKEDA